MLEESGDQVSGYLRYATELFEHDTVERLSQHWLRLLEGMVLEPNREIGMLPMLSDEERWQVVEGWNQTAGTYAGAEDVLGLFEAQVVETPGAVAVEAGNEQLTYGALDAQANVLGHELRAAGVGPEQVVAVSLERSPAMVVALLGIWKAGGAYLPVDPSIRQRGRRRC